MISNARLSLACFSWLLATFLVAKSTCQIRSSLKSVYFSSRRDSPGKMQAQEVAGHVVSAVRREGEKRGRKEGGGERELVMTQLTFPLFSLGTPVHVVGSSEWVLPPQFWKYCHRHTQNLVSKLIQNTIWLTMESNRSGWRQIVLGCCFF